MKTKLTLVLAAAITSTAFGAMPAHMPEFKNEKQLVAWRAEMAAKPTSQKYAAEPSAFYTGKPYIVASGAYAYKYRSYNPELARWTSEDPSGFPDGANGNIYAPVPTSEFDYQGLLVTATYSITKRTLTIDGHEYNNCNSGDNDYNHRFALLGPIPTGNYEIFSRHQGSKDYNTDSNNVKHTAFILDPIDSTRYNDQWNGQTNGNDRYGFRIHDNITTRGCIATADIDAITTRILATSHTTQHDIVQSPTIEGFETFDHEWYLGKLKVVE